MAVDRTIRPGRALLLLGWVVSLLLLATPVHAEPADDKQRVDREIAQTEASLETVTDTARQAVLDYNQAMAAIPGAQAALAEANGQVVGAQAAARQADRTAAVAKAAADAAAAAYQVAAADVERTRAQIAAFVSSAYRGSNFAMINAILDSQTPSDFVNSIGYLDRIAESRQIALSAYVDSRMRARQSRDQADAARANADQAAEAARSALAQAQARQAQAQSAATNLQNLANQREHAASVAESERGAVLTRYNDLTAQSERLAEELRAAANVPTNGPADVPTGGPADVPAASAGGFFTQPVAGWKSSDFGMRFDPYYHVWHLHAGTDFAAGGGAPIAAAGGGTVVRAGWFGGYGNYTCLNHGVYNGQVLTTCYGHQSAILVAVGQHVGRGAVIGRVGTTGASTGNHLHFEVRLNGGPVNPLGWL